MNGRENLFFPYLNLDFIICFLLYFRELKIISSDYYAMRRRTVLVSNTRSDGIIDKVALVCVETILAQPFKKQLE